MVALMPSAFMFIAGVELWRHSRTHCAKEKSVDECLACVLENSRRS